jgi:hypothetical protein
LAANPDYGLLSRWLHTLALGSDAVGGTAFDLESALFSVDPAQVDGRPVFVAGLARAGTTLLMRLLHETGAFSSLTYRDMPFLLAPNLWRRMSAPFARPGAAAERAHGDGLLVDVDSPEALEEVFWRVHCREDYIRPDRLLPMVASDEVIARFRAYVGRILLCHGGGRYLSKNNNNLLRLPSLRKAFPQAIILVPFRDPVEQARSLLAQHRRFCQLQREDPFVARYMTWLVHHEFGLDHRPFDWDGLATPGLSPDDLDYWLAQWIAAYRHLLGMVSALTLSLVDYDCLCAEPVKVWTPMAQGIGIDASLPTALVIRKFSGAPVEPGVDSQLVAQAMDIHRQLVTASGRQGSG